MKHRQFILATDLDGTFLGGSQDQRAALYDWIESARSDVGLIFVSGRDLPFIEYLCRETGVPWPDYVIGDVGTTIAQVHPENDDDGRRVAPIPQLETEISKLWNNRADEIKAALDGASGLTLQPTPFRYRVSYDLDPGTYDDAAGHRIREMGFDVLISDNRFFDVLPPGISKGPSLKRLIEFLEVEDEKVLVAGDTMNDLSLFETGLRGVAVGNSEAGLLAKVTDKSHVYVASSHGAGGIAEAVHHHEMSPKKRPPLNV
ncbi:MAG: HAD-IIB family hydrolase [Pseudomonadota bacterium]